MTRPVYLPWIRSGLAAAVTNIDPLSGPLPTRTTFTASAVVDGRPATVPVWLLGPGDGTGVQRELVRRTQPTDGAIEVEPHYFAVAELRASDMPWMFTPAAANQDRLRPWLVLVVVPEAQCPLKPGSPDRLAVLHVDNVSTQLPDLAQSYAWAHAEIPGLGSLVGATKPPGFARLMCPRLLEQHTTYVAAVVPAFEPGRLAGLGLAVPDQPTMKPAWDTATDGPLDLPVYYSWRFTTGADGDFESLVSRLKRIHLGEETATGLAADVPEQHGLPALPDWQFPGALGFCPDPMPGTAFTHRLTELADGTDIAPGVPVAPPTYGARHAAEPTLTGAVRPWLRRLNLDPRYRAAAALGARLVEENQDELMAAAWRQIDAVEEANVLLRQAQMARAAGEQIHRRLAELSAAVLEQVAGPMLTRLTAAGTKRTEGARLAASRVPRVMVSGAFRRVLRPRGPLVRRGGASAAQVLLAVEGGKPVVSPPGPPDGIVTIDQQKPDAVPPWCQIGPDAVLERAEQPQTPANKEQWRNLLTALAAAQQGKPPCNPVPPRGGPIPLSDARTAILDATIPADTVLARISGRVTGPPGWAPADPLTPIMTTPRIDTPLSRDLIELSANLLLPGVAGMPVEAVTAVPANHRFIEALQIGANQHAMRIFLWCGYPTDQRGTPLHRFWDRAGSVSGAADDIPDIDHTWTGELGTHQIGDAAQVVLLVRGEVLQRFPDTEVYAAQARWVDGRRRPVTVPDGSKPGDATHPGRYPAFRGKIPPDVAFFGFDLPADPLGDPDPNADNPGWFFVFQQPMAQTRFGLDATRSENVPGQGPGDLSWLAVTVNHRSNHIDLSGPLSQLDLPGWGTDATSADLARWCEQPPFRICVHASDLLPEEQP